MVQWIRCRYVVAAFTGIPLPRLSSVLGSGEPGRPYDIATEQAVQCQSRKVYENSRPR